MPNAINNISTLPAELQTLLSQSPQVFVDFLTEGMPWIKNNFTIAENDGRTPLWSMEMLDFLRPASDAWQPQQALKLSGKVPVFQDIDGDLEMPRSEVISLARSHVKIIAGAPSLKEVLESKPFAYFFLQKITAQAGVLLETKSLFRGVRSASPVAQGASLSMNGLNFKITAGIASGDIPASNVYAAAATIDATNAYAEVRALCQKTESNVALDGRPLNYYLSPSQYRAYCINRRTANPNTVSPGERPKTVDDYDHITFVLTPGLSGSQKHIITVKENLYFCIPEGFFAPAIRMIEDVKLFKINLLLSATVEYNFGKALFTNNKP